MPLAFLDTNIILRHLVQDHPDHSPRATAFIERVARGEVAVRTTDTVIFESVFTLQRYYRWPRAQIRHALLPIVDLDAVTCPGKERVHRAFDLYLAHGVSFA